MTDAPLDQSRWRRFEPRAASHHDLSELRTLLTGYAEPGASRNRNPTLAPVHASSQDRPEPLPATLAILISLFHECHYVFEDEVPAGMLALLHRIGLIARSPDRPGLVYATAAILPVAGERIVCDRGGPPDGSSDPLPPDVVYPPIFDNSRRYLAILPSTPCQAMLEIGTGAGLAAVLAARHAAHVWATDLTARAVDFASFNCRLANRNNVTVLAGDLYSPVEALTFDRIAIHPPWVSAGHSDLVVGDGPEDGETILRRSIQGLPRFLRSNGRFYTVFLASDRAGEQFEERVRRWLGDHQREFDIVVAEFSVDSTQAFLAENVRRGTIDESEIPVWTALFDATHTEAMVYGQMILQRHGAARAPVTLRMPAEQGLSGRQLEALLPRP